MYIWGLSEPHLGTVDLVFVPVPADIAAAYVLGFQGLIDASNHGIK